MSKITRETDLVEYFKPHKLLGVVMQHVQKDCDLDLTYYPNNIHSEIRVIVCENKQTLLICEIEKVKSSK